MALIFTVSCPRGYVVWPVTPLCDKTFVPRWSAHTALPPATVGGRAGETPSLTHTGTDVDDEHDQLWSERSGLDLSDVVLRTEADREIELSSCAHTAVDDDSPSSM
ncbi:hypothetical protein STCU_12266 [Strigomonas culicis]|uniref:Uncharacterized protein n=1 Tax=Strigomonas culicis TaxID=28005 RepID=S9UKL6_9TRYP|nr:hypothetical protein STCU_12266 [Strigomonas culicis]|eukprot:EPY15191.1 hypothetical protein STCU_12266 [Strigomonas culicis]